MLRHMFRSSYSQILQVWDGSQREEAAFITAGVYDDFSRALLCISSVECKYGLFEKDLKRCFLVNVKPDLSQRRSDELESEKVLLKKVNNDVSQCNSILIDIFQQTAT